MTVERQLQNAQRHLDSAARWLRAANEKGPKYMNSVRLAYVKAALITIKLANKNLKGAIDG